MLAALVVLLRSLALLYCGHRAVALEHWRCSGVPQSVPRSAAEIDCSGFCSPTRGEIGALTVVQPDTVVRWHREWLRRRWTQLSTPTRPGRPSTPWAIRTLVAQMATAN